MQLYYPNELFDNGSFKYTHFSNIQTYGIEISKQINPFRCRRWYRLASQEIHQNKNFEPHSR